MAIFLSVLGYRANVKKMLERAFFFAYVKKKLYLCTILVI